MLGSKGMAKSRETVAVVLLVVVLSHAVVARYQHHESGHSESEILNSVPDQVAIHCVCTCHDFFGFLARFGLRHSREDGFFAHVQWLTFLLAMARRSSGTCGKPTQKRV